MSVVDHQGAALAQGGGSHDPARRRKAKRSGEERGVWVFIPASVLEAAGIDPRAKEPFYRTWGARRGSVLVRLYRQR